MLNPNYLPVGALMSIEKEMMKIVFPRQGIDHILPINVLEICLFPSGKMKRINCGFY